MSLVGFSARNHPQQAARDWVDDRRTPRALFDPLHAEFSFTLDVAASATNALLPRYLTRHDDGLLRSWRGERVWCNPPYSRLEPWLAKAWQEMRDGCELVAMILPANRTEQKFWQQYVEPFRDGGARRRDASHTIPERPSALRCAGCAHATQGRPTAIRLRPPDLHSN